MFAKEIADINYIDSLIKTKLSPRWLLDSVFDRIGEGNAVIFSFIIEMYNRASFYTNSIVSTVFNYFLPFGLQSISGNKIVIQFCSLSIMAYGLLYYDGIHLVEIHPSACPFSCSLHSKWTHHSYFNHHLQDTIYLIVSYCTRIKWIDVGTMP